MNHKQKLGYMAVGALILALGITIGQVITPSIEAQSNGVFDRIECSVLTLVDELGNEQIQLAAGSDLSYLIFTDGDKTPISIARSANNARIALKADSTDDLAASVRMGVFNDLGSSINLKMRRYELDLSCYADSAIMQMEDIMTAQKFAVEFDPKQESAELVLAKDDTGITMRGDKQEQGITVSDGRYILGRLPQR